MIRTIIEPKPGPDACTAVALVVIENVEDRERADRGEIGEELIRQIETEARLDSRMLQFALPESLIQRLGLQIDRRIRSRKSNEITVLNVYRGAMLTVQGRSITEEVLALSNNRNAVIGRLPLLKLDFWIDVSNHRLVGNPEHDGKWMAELF